MFRRGSYDNDALCTMDVMILTREHPRPGGVQWRAAVWPMPGDSQTPFVAQRPGGPKWVGYGYCGKWPWNSNCLLSLPISQIHLFRSKSLKSLDYLSNLCTYCTKSKSVKVVLLDIFNLGRFFWAPWRREDDASLGASQILLEHWEACKRCSFQHTDMNSW